MKTLTLTIICMSFIALTTHAQIVNIPDANFKVALIAYGVDLNSDGDIQVSEAQAVTTLDVSSHQIADLTGIEAFINLTSLDCSCNQLTTFNFNAGAALEYLKCNYNHLAALDVSPLTALVRLECTDNLLISLNVSNCTQLFNLKCSYNQLTSLDISNNAALSSFFCSDNHLTALDVSNNNYLFYFDCSGNHLTALDVSNNIHLCQLYCYSNPYLFIICVNNNQLVSAISNPFYWQKDAAASWSTTCFTSVDEINHLNCIPKLVHIYNVMGQEVTREQQKNGVYIYQYSDGSVKKMGRFDDEK